MQSWPWSEHWCAYGFRLDCHGGRPKGLRSIRCVPCRGAASERTSRASGFSGARLPFSLGWVTGAFTSVVVRRQIIFVFHTVTVDQKLFGGHIRLSMKFELATGEMTLLDLTLTYLPKILTIACSTDFHLKTLTSFSIFRGLGSP